MEIIIRVQEHTEHELHLQHKLSFSPLSDVNNENKKEMENIISTTADSDGFTTLSAICRVLDLPIDLIEKNADECNALKRSRLIDSKGWGLFMVPKWRSDNIIEYPEYYISELIKVADYFKSGSIHFTHYSFIQSFPRDEIIRQMILLANPVFVPSVEKFYWEIDSRFFNELVDAYTYVVENVYRRPPKELRVIRAKKFKFLYEKTTGDIEIGRFVEDA